MTFGWFFFEVRPLVAGGGMSFGVELLGRCCASFVVDVLGCMCISSDVDASSWVDMSFGVDMLR
jgi:hypothetical protein